MDATVQETFGLLTAIVVLAGIAVLVVNGGNTAKVVGAGGGAFVNALRVATKGGK